MTTHLATEHYTELSVLSGIPDTQIEARGYATVAAGQLPAAFADYQKRDGLLIPIRTVRGEIESYQIKPTKPRLNKDGKPIKYETAANAPQVIDVPGAALPHLSNPNMPLIITEGAKKVDSAVGAGLVSTIGLQGVYGWRGKGSDGGKTALADWESIALNDRQVLIAFDSDVMTKESVRGALDRLAAFLRSRGAKPCYLLLPPLDDGAKCGLDDWLALGHDINALNDHIVADLPELPQAADAEATAGVARAVVVSMDEIEAKPIDWLWPNWLPRGMLTLLGGYAGDGKSTITMSLAATLSRGGTLPDGTRAPQVNTLLLVAEDDLSHVVKPRLQVHDTDVTRVKVMKHIDEPDGRQRSINLKRDVPFLREAIRANNIGLVVIDPLSSYLAASDRNNEGEVRDTLQPLVQLMEETGVAMIGIMHIGKNDGQARAMQKLMGSTAFTALARCVWMVNTLPEDLQAEGEPTRKMLGVSKSNYAIAPAPLVFSRPQDGAIAFHGPSPIGIEEVFQPRRAGGDDRKTMDAESWLEDALAPGPQRLDQLERSAKEDGISRASLFRAKKKAGILSDRTGNGAVWRLPGESLLVA